MDKYKEAQCCKCLGEILVLENDNADFYCNSCAWAKFGSALGFPNSAPNEGLDS